MGASKKSKQRKLEKMAVQINIQEATIGEKYSL